MNDTATSISNGTINAEHASAILETLANDIMESKEKANLSVKNSQQTMQIAEDGQQSEMISVRIWRKSELRQSNPGQQSRT